MIKNADIHFNHLGTPVADNFDDVYFSNDDGLAESNYVFYQQNDIPRRLQNHDQAHFVIGETGFGTGLNFLNSWLQFKNHLANRQHDENKVQKQQNVNRLHFISFEKYPIKHSDLAIALAAWPELALLSEQLVAHYPINLAGCHRLEFENGQVVLDLHFGDVQESINNMAYNQSGLIDAWYLDGFAPSKNPAMWQQSLFNLMVDISRNSATLATFTAAGFVRRGLIEAGFEIQKAKGFGRKREMLTGKLTQANAAYSAPPYFANQASELNNVAVIGGGIASSAVLYSLAKRGIHSQLFCQDSQLAMGASHNVQGAVYPHLQAKNSPHSEFFAHSFLYAKRVYQQLTNNGFSYDHQWCGVLQHAVKQPLAERHQNIETKQLWPNELMHSVTPEQADEIAGVESGYAGVYFPLAGWVNPPQLVNALFEQARTLSDIQSHFNCDIDTLEKTANGWILKSEHKQFGPFTDVIICAGEHSDRFTQTKALPIVGVRGQVSHVTASEASKKLKTVLCHKGYFTPAYLGKHCMGATFEKNSKSREVTEQDNVTNREQLLNFYGQCDFATSLGEIKSAKAAVRCSFIDHLPMAGQWAEQSDYINAFANLRLGKRYQYQPLQKSQQGLHLLTGFGARGFCSAPLAAEHLIANLNNEPSPLSERVSQAIHPARFIVRDLIRNKI
ncbi:MULTISPECIES: bifunctional tRNA (5-methylaminomethyl-2-thiouridine)(34)-methyltransferase MnmD/FAD-dependent 5-carboxymethylaminomethyl-2-thiouridine(34) oxidoreductase MnmC [unclassified Pseudoalteromonas]|uniref:bifunctional tRNA (5-methylaminomethyl-2-thiouridine)(34)-methyltransferase MnmD/FAD-dependent 5-carboxymethylaminomethyl-2-thiouridine(34) oxidoreductase MnmC n=1 Tax=unclassified Pseudoalteromonas TaxID=194690 RepID=UPI0025B5D10F|nr:MULTISPECIES: bifunctional tRNA (5-methylaminomethyl-2-thiouridine)(34)-methyltransferase MnmD/FAD-dependent 5-carboxymethylaminomethyl-2-thiouridine(34) oxidoreductase MnmC [unclassified Pseudoalteromonas]MDN3377036.1 bifunctional tRNA (5-methylaminomethyl-2-thiouridine)(34)-methyltransferase MnmD/FAD-dependent 5-carboxymethylaminomethyl-2-thiouridine(34) oxidoreductase MnmC [Pseudoalteromonas sp. APC 3893]MDN3385795.1 bifunctional tRNA (5-methylaminomethyl-2-thiouridine)(34)-methyltransferas